MQRLDLFFRAFEAYKKLTENSEHDRDLMSVALACAQNDTISVVHTQCVVKTDWIEAIEEGLVYIEKAINENRQFILSHGEVEPIEKVKRVSKDSVEHLSRHSDLITKEQSGDTIIPDKLYEVERLTDFAVYENRFLYMLLVYLESFIVYRYNKIVDLTNSYRGSLSIQKTVALTRRKLNFDLKLQDEILFDEYFQKNNTAKDEIERIDLLLKAVSHFLATPIMQEVGKKPLLKPPITRTNVLKMNNNFKNAFMCYQFVTSYEGDGFIVQENVKTVNPFMSPLDSEMAEVILFLSFLTYQHGLGLREKLKLSYETELGLARQREIELQKQRLNSLKKRVEEGGDPYEYILELEKENHRLQKDSQKLTETRAHIAALNQQIEDLSADMTNLNRTIEGFEGQIAEIIDSHSLQLNNLTAEHEEKLRLTTSQYEHKIMVLNDAHDNEFRAIKSDFNLQMTEREQQLKKVTADFEAAKSAFATEVKELNAAHLSYVDDMTKKHMDELSGITRTHDSTVLGLMDAHNQQINKLNALIEDKSSEIERLNEECLLAQARFNSLRAQYNLFEGEDFTTESAFTEIEKQFNIFKAFFKDEWKKTKRRIKRETTLDKDGEE